MGFQKLSFESAGEVLQGLTCADSVDSLLENYIGLITEFTGKPCEIYFSSDNYKLNCLCQNFKSSGLNDHPIFASESIFKTSGQFFLRENQFNILILKTAIQKADNLFTYIKWKGEEEPAKSQISQISFLTNLLTIHFSKFAAWSGQSESEQKYRQLVEESSEIIYLCDYKGNFKFINSFVTKITGFEISDIEGRNFLTFIREDFREKAAEFYKNQFEKRISNTYFEFPVIAKNGSEIWLGQNVQLFIKDGRVDELQAVARDITERFRTQQLLVESEARFHTLSKNGHAAIFLCDTEGNVVHVNEKYCEFTGLPESELMGLGYLRTIHPDDKERVLNLWGKLLKTGANMELEFRLVKPGGRSVWVYFQAGAVKGKDHKITGYIGTLLDIGVRKKAEKLASESKEKMEAVFNHSYDAIILLDPSSGEIADCNFRALEMFKVKSKEDCLQLSGNDLRTFMMHGQNSTSRKDVSVKKIYTAEVLYRTATGSAFWGGLVMKKIIIGGHVFELFRVTDISESKSIEQELIKAKVDAESAMKAREQFLSVVSHEIRTPLNAVIGMTEWLIQDKPRNSQLEFLQGIKYSSDTLLNLINDILDFSKIESGKITFEQIEFSISTVLNNVYKTFKLKAEEKKLGFKIENHIPAPGLFVGDPVKLTQILLNVVSNAIKFTSKGCVELLVDWLTDQEKHLLRFTLKDTGIGIPEEKLNEIFESFTQASSDTTRKFGGSGLGLTICKHLVELQGGKISVSSQQGEGSVFTIEIPFSLSENEKIVVQAEPDYNIFSDLKVLLVEDNLMNQLLTTTFLEKWNVHVKVASNGNEAIDIMQSDNFDIIFMDLHMPGMDGFEAARYIRNNLKLADLPIIALTASVLLDVREKVLGSGMNDFITKPFKPYELNAKLSFHLPQKIVSRVTGV